MTISRHVSFIIEFFFLPCFFSIFWGRQTCQNIWYVTIHSTNTEGGWEEKPNIVYWAFDQNNSFIGSPKVSEFFCWYFVNFLFGQLIQALTPNYVFLKSFSTKEVASPGVWTQAFYVTVCYPCPRTTQDFLTQSWKRGFINDINML